MPHPRRPPPPISSPVVVAAIDKIPNFRSLLEAHAHALVQNIRQKFMPRNAMILFAAITIGTVVATDALAAGRGGGGGRGGDRGDRGDRGNRW